MDHKLISYCDIKNKIRLDQGQFGVVYRAEYNELTVAAKEITPPDTGQEFVKTFKREVEINSQLDHDNIVKFYGACYEPFCILMEYVEGGSLYNWIYKRRFLFDDDTILSLLLGMTRGLKYLHDLKVLHRDLKSKNVLIVEGEVLSAKLCDFGVSKTLNATMNVNTQEIGTVRWMAPEVMSSNTYNHKCDIYSLGVTMYEILEMDLPYKDDEPFRIMMMKAIEKKSLELSRCVAKSNHQIFVNLFNRCVQYDPGERPNLLEILLKLQNADLCSGSDTILEVDEDTRLAWELQQAEYQSLSIITQADEQYAVDLQQRFYQQNIQPYYSGAARHNPAHKQSKWRDRDYRGGLSFTPDDGSIDHVEHEDSSGYLDQLSPSHNLEFIYCPSSLQSNLEESSDSIGTAREPEPEPSDLAPLLVRLNLEENPLSQCSTQSDTLTPATNPLTPSPSPSPSRTAMYEDPRDLGSEERNILDRMALSPVVVDTRLGAFVDLGSTGSLPDLCTPHPVCKSASMDLTSKRTSPMSRLLKLIRLDSRNKPPDQFREAKNHRRPQLDPTTRSQTLDTPTQRGRFPQTEDPMHFSPPHTYQRAASDFPAS